MVSLITMAINAVTTAFLYVVKAFFSIVLWFVKLLFKALRMLYVLLPLTSLVFAALFIFNIFQLATNTSIQIPLEGENGDLIRSLMTGNRQNLSAIFSALWSWWTITLDAYRGNAAYWLLIILAVLMFLPVHCVFLIYSVFSSFWLIIFAAIVADAVLYVVRALCGNHVIPQIRGRYCRVFPKAGLKYEEKEYAKNLKQRNRELREEEHERKRRRYDAYYEESEPEDYPEEDFYEEDYPGEDDGYDEEYEEEEDDYDEPGPAPTTSFDFFAGCNSRESVDRKYRSLVKLYHPDNMDGDTAALQEINVQYSEAKKRFS